MNSINVTNKSYLQDQKQGIESSKYQPIKPALVGEIFQSHGFSLVDLKSGQSQKKEFENHQKTITRFRHNLVDAKGLQLDITMIAPHLGRGALELILGTFRLICTNGLSVGSTYGSYKVKHIGDVHEHINQAVTILMSQRDTLAKQIEAMSQVQLSDTAIYSLAQELIAERLKDVNFEANSINPREVIQVRREGDKANDLFTVFNRIQESLMRYGVSYLQKREVLTQQGVETKIFQCSTRPVKPLSALGIKLNQELWNKTIEFGKVG